MGRLLLHELLGNDARDMTTLLVHRIGQLPHDPYACPAVDQLDTLLGQDPPQLPRCGPVVWTRAGIGSAKDTDPVHLPIVGHRLPRREDGATSFLGESR